MKKSFIVVIIFIFNIGCKKNNDRIISIEGIWIESSLRKDTIEFKSSSSLFDLKMGKELRNGFLLPKINAGLYIYVIEGDSISMQYLLSSFYSNKRYSYNIDQRKGKLTLGNFYKDNLARNAPLNFVKIQ